MVHGGCHEAIPFGTCESICPIFDAQCPKLLMPRPSSKGGGAPVVARRADAGGEPEKIRGKTLASTYDWSLPGDGDPGGGLVGTI